MISKVETVWILLTDWKLSDSLQFSKLQFGFTYYIVVLMLFMVALCTASSSGCQLNFAALNRGRQLCSAGRPSGWALAHILVSVETGCWLLFFTVAMCLWLALLNALKAFDRVSYMKLVGVMFDKRVPARLIKLRIICSVTAMVRRYVWSSGTTAYLNCVP